MTINSFNISDFNKTLDNVKSIFVNAESMSSEDKLKFYESRMRFLEAEASIIDKRIKDNEAEINNSTFAEKDT